MSLRYNEISMKASHNSYDKGGLSLTAQLEWESNAPYNRGCGALELDVSEEPTKNMWSVSHSPFYSEDKEKQLSAYLAQLSKWSAENPKHDAITLHVDLKSVISGEFYKNLDAYIKMHLEAPIFSPRELFGSENTLNDGAKNNGWPTTENLKGKFIICLTGNSGKKELYAKTSPKERLCFADKDKGKNETPNKDDFNHLFFNYHIYNIDRSTWMATFKKISAEQPHVIIRTYISNSESNWNSSLNSGVNLIATDEITGRGWSKVGDSRFVKRRTL